MSAPMQLTDKVRTTPERTYIRLTDEKRKAIVEAIESGLPSREVAQIFQTKCGTVKSVYYTWKTEGRTAKKQKVQGQPLLKNVHKEKLAHWLNEYGDLTCRQLREIFHGEFGFQPSISTIFRAVRHIKSLSGGDSGGGECSNGQSSSHHHNGSSQVIIEEESSIDSITRSNIREEYEESMEDEDLLEAKVDKMLNSKNIKTLHGQTSPKPMSRSEANEQSTINNSNRGEDLAQSSKKFRNLLSRKHIDIKNDTHPPPDVLSSEDNLKNLWWYHSLADNLTRLEAYKHIHRSLAQTDILE